MIEYFAFIENNLFTQQIFTQYLLCSRGCTGRTLDDMGNVKYRLLKYCDLKHIYSMVLNTICEKECVYIHTHTYKENKTGKIL